MPKPDAARRVGDELPRGVEVADEATGRPADGCRPGDVERVAEERDVWLARVLIVGRDGVAAVEQLEVVAADQPRDEDRVPAAADVLGERGPRHGRAARVA